MCDYAYLHPMRFLLWAGPGCRFFLGGLNIPQNNVFRPLLLVRMNVRMRSCLHLEYISCITLTQSPPIASWVRNTQGFSALGGSGDSSGSVIGPLLFVLRIGNQSTSNVCSKDFTA
jgi:hypothetical protein